MSEVETKEAVVTIGLSDGNTAAPYQGVDPGLMNNLMKGEPEKRIAEVIDGLVSDRKAWESSEYVNSNKRLYGLLQNCLILHNTMVGSDALAKALRKGLSNYITQKHYSFRDSTPLMTKIVKCVFGVDRRRVHSYATALIAAKEKRISVIELPNWLKEQGGVEEVRRGSKPSGNTQAARVADGKVVLQADVLAVVQSDKLNAQCSTESLSEGVVLLATRGDDGAFSIRRVITADSVVKAAIASCSAMGKTLKKKLQIEAEASAAEAARLDVQNALKAA